MKCFEYKVVRFDHQDHIEHQLNKLGREGWELVSLTSGPQIGSSKYALVGVTLDTTAIMKRRYMKAEVE